MAGFKVITEGFAKTIGRADLVAGSWDMAETSLSAGIGSVFDGVERKV